MKRDPNMKFKTSDNTELDYQIKGRGKPLIFITGFGGHQEVWSSQVDYFSKHGYQVITYDHRNFGKSQRTKVGHTSAQLTHDLIELLAFLKISKAAFIGHSMGGSVLYNLLYVKPELVELAVVVDQTPYMLNEQDWPYGYLNYDKNNYLELLQNQPKVHETLNGLDDDVFAKLKPAKIAHPFSREDNLDLLQEHMKHDWRPTVQDTQVPLYIVAAAQSPYYDANFGKWMDKQNKKVHFILVDQSGHDIMAEQPDEFNRILAEILKENNY